MASHSVSFTQMSQSLPESCSLPAKDPLPDPFLVIETNRGKDLELSPPTPR